MNHKLFLEVNQQRNHLKFEFQMDVNYPSNKFDFGAIQIYIEGSVYNLSNEQLSSEIEDWVTHSNGDVQQFYQLTQKWDGDYNWFIENKLDQTIAFGNDYFGRLPLYYSVTEQQVVISRSIKQCVEVISPSINRYSLASTLLFGFAIDNQTLYESILKFPRNSYAVIELNLNKELITIVRGAPFDLTHQANEVDVDLLIQYLSESLLNRIEHYPSSALALSGGLDSRLIASLLKLMHKEIPHYTFNYLDWYNKDVKSAHLISTQLGIKNHSFITMNDTKLNEQVEQLFEIKEGQNFLGMAFMLPFLAHYRKHKLTMLTGDGGDKTLESVFPIKTLSSSEDFISYLLIHNSIINLKDVSKITNLSASEIRSYIMRYIQTYPDSSWNNKYARFIIQERGLNWLVEGEDRNRYFSWTLSPFYSKVFFEYALSISPHHKRNGNLFKQLFENLPGDLNQVDNPNWNVAPGNLSAMKFLELKKKIKLQMPFLKRKNKVSLTVPEWIAHFDISPVELTSHHPFNINALADLKCTENQFWYVYTVCRMVQNC